MAKYGADSSDKAVLHVKYRTDNGLIRVENKSYLPPLEWTRLTNDEMPDFITFKGGLNFDFILHGEWSSDEIINDSDYGSDAGFYNYMSRQYDEVFAVSSVARYSVIPHFEILLK
ncbi:MAG: hypothetical protein J6R01_08100 [Alistipes sp.]|nr:hypothetical protein [Alistipes sp.]